MPISKINLQQHRRKVSLLFCLFYLFFQFEHFHFIVRHDGCLQLLFQPCSISAFKRLWEAWFQNPFSSGRKTAKLGNMCTFLFPFNCFGMICRTRSTVASGQMLFIKRTVRQSKPKTPILTALFKAYITIFDCKFAWKLWFCLLTYTGMTQE